MFAYNIYCWTSEHYSVILVVPTVTLESIGEGLKVYDTVRNVQSIDMFSPFPYIIIMVTICPSKLYAYRIVWNEKRFTFPLQFRFHSDHW